MDVIINLMDKIYGDSNTLITIYIVGAVLLVIFITLLIISLRAPKAKEKILEEPKNDDKELNESEKIEEKETIESKKIEIDKIDENSNIIEDLETKSDHNDKLIDNNENEESHTDSIDISNIVIDETKKAKIEEDSSPIEIALENIETKKEEPEEIKKVSVDIPDIDSYADDVVKKVYEKNEQFSSVFVGDNTSTIKLDKVLDNLNVDEDIKDDLVEDSNKGEKVKESTSAPSNLDDLKIAMEDKKKEVELKQDELKQKLFNLKNSKIKSEETKKAEDLLNKLKDVQ